MNKTNQEFVDTIKDSMKKDKRRTASSFLVYMGSKGKLAPQIIPFFPSHKIYVEPFLGSAAVFFRKPSVDASVLNDTNNNIVNLFKNVRDNLDEMINWCWWTPLAKVTFDTIRKLFDSKHWRELDPFIRAVAYFYLHQNTFNTKLTTKKFHPGVINKWNRESVVYKLYNASEKLQGAILENRDWKELVDIDFYNAKNSFWYLDPPYYKANDSGYYETNFTHQHHWDLALGINKLKGKFMISYDDEPEIREYYKNYYITSTKPQKYSASFGETVTKKEIIITNYPIQDMVKQTSLLEGEELFV